MARTQTEIENIMLNEKAAQPALDDLTSESTTAIWLLWIKVVATAILSIEKLFDAFIELVRNIIANLKPGTALWYVNKVKQFQYGFNLVPEKDVYDNTGIADYIVQASKIITYAAFEDEPPVRMKLAKTIGADLVKLSPNELAAAVAYVKRFKYAGVDLNSNTITSTDPDKLKLSLTVKYNPLVLNGMGARLDGTNTEPIKDGIKFYLKNLDFNGVFSIKKLEDQLQKVEGVGDFKIDSIESKYGALPFTSFTINMKPDSGYMIIENQDLTIIYQPA